MPPTPANEAVALDIVLENRRPVLRLRGAGADIKTPGDVLVTLLRPDTSSEVFTFRRAGADLLSVEPLSPPFRFDARIAIGRLGQVQAVTRRLWQGALPA